MGLLDLLSPAAKLSIEAFDVKPDGPQKFTRTSLNLTFTAMFNPETLKISYGSKIVKKSNGSEKKVDAVLNNPGKLQIKLLLDKTGVTDMGIQNLLSSGKDSVKTQIDNFLTTVYKINNQTHARNHLLLAWGDIKYYCQLETVDITVSLFDRGGKPLRAVLDCIFIDDGTNDKAAYPFFSPDITRTRIVREGDTLPSLCKELYDSSNYYIKVAKANGLKEFRNIKPGTTLYFPPIKKSK